eukprot:594710-Rhodomonas_salina.3
MKRMNNVEPEYPGTVEKAEVAPARSSGKKVRASHSKRAAADAQSVPGHWSSQNTAPLAVSRFPISFSFFGGREW